MDRSLTKPKVVVIINHALVKHMNDVYVFAPGSVFAAPAVADHALHLSKVCIVVKLPEVSLSQGRA
jgi:hypothetical protein